MIYDADVHISRTETNGQPVEELLRQMDAAGIDRALVWQQPPYFRDVDEANRYVYLSAKAHPNRLTPFGWVDPHFGVDKSIETIRRCLDEYGMPGIKLNGAQNAFYVSFAKYLREVEGLPVKYRGQASSAPVAGWVATQTPAAPSACLTTGAIR